MSSKTTRLLLPVLLLAIVAANVLVVGHSRTPRAYGHDPLTRGLDTLAMWHTEGVAGAVHFLRADGMVVDYQWTHLVGSALLAVSGHAWRAMVLAPTFWLLVLLVSLFFIGRKLRDDTAGLLAVAAALACPGIVGWSWVYASITANMAWVALTVCLLLHSEHGARWAWALAAGAAAALGVKSGEAVGEAFLNGLTALLAAGLLLAPALLKGRRRGLIGAGLFVASFAALLDWPWLIKMTPYLLRETGATMPTAIEGGAPAWASYLPALFTHAVFFEFALLALGGSVWLLRRFDARRWAMVAWWLVPLAALSLVEKKNLLYLAVLTPALPVIVGVAASEWIERLAAARFRRVAAPALVGVFVLVLGLNVLAPAWGHGRIERGKARYAPAFQLDVPNLVPRPTNPGDDQTEALVAAALACRPQSALLIGNAARPIDRMLGSPEQAVRFLFYLEPESPPLTDLFFGLGPVPTPADHQRILAHVLATPPDAFILLEDFADASRDDFIRLLSAALGPSTDTVAPAIAQTLPTTAFQPGAGRRFRLPFPSATGQPFVTARLVCADPAGGTPQ